MCKNPTEGSSISFQDINQASLKDEKRSSVLADLLCMLTFFNCVSQEEAVVGEGGEEFLMQGRQWRAWLKIHASHHFFFEPSPGRAWWVQEGLENHEFRISIIFTIHTSELLVLKTPLNCRVVALQRCWQQKAKEVDYLEFQQSTVNDCLYGPSSVRRVLSKEISHPYWIWHFGVCKTNLQQVGCLATQIL